MNHRIANSLSIPRRSMFGLVVGAAVVGQGLNKDIPGYSQPLRMRYASVHMADDLIREMRFLCGVPQADDLAGASHPSPPDPATPFGDVCNQTGVTR